jgi:Kef-type K+ transport system membrane component KefB
VLKDLGRSQQAESKIILGAAVIDDVLGLIVLAIVSGLIQQANSGADFELASLGIIVGKAVGFLVGAIVLGKLFAKPFFTAATYLYGHGLLVACSLVVCFGFAYLANLVGLAPIVGAFAAGLILEHAHYADLVKKEDQQLEHVIRPIAALLVPVFFVEMGVEVKLDAFLTNPSVWGLAAALTVVAIIGKQVCAFGVLEKGLNRRAIGLGMIPRGEVGLIFAAVGASLVLKGQPVVDQSTYAALIVMVMATTMVTPPLLKWSMGGALPPGSEPAPRHGH